VDPAWAEAAARALSPASLLRVASDHEEYFGVIDDVLSNEPLLEKLTPDEAGDWSTGTSYELKFLKTGRPIYKAVFRRRASGSAS
jgi:tRNA G46 methylase TrmB